MELNNDQKNALNFLRIWWNGTQTFLILSGKGGTGKTFLVNYFLKNLKEKEVIKPLALAPTNEALRILKEGIDVSCEFRTVSKALGYIPTLDSKTGKLVFKDGALDKVWDNVNLAIIDESSMLSETDINKLMSIGIKILFIGHDAQLPPVDPSRKRYDKCESPIFKKGFSVVTLKTPMRNTGALWDFNNILEEMVYDFSIKLVPLSIFDKKPKEVKEQLFSSKQELEEGKLKLVLWRNQEVDRLNLVARKIIFGEQALKEKYLVGDKIILTSPTFEVNGKLTASSLISSLDKEEVISTNTKCTVLNVTKGILSVNFTTYSSFKLESYYLTVLDEATNTRYRLITLVNDKDKEQFAEESLKIARSARTQKEIAKLFKLRSAYLSVFADVKHFYAATTYRLQGSSVNKVIVFDKDLIEVPNVYEERKHRYVACSRAMGENLTFFRGAYHFL